jgi:hypothetical protein
MARRVEVRRREESMTEIPMDIGRSPVPVGSTGAIFSCPECGSFLDTPRTDPHSGDLARKCAACTDWYPVTGDSTQAA